MNFVSLEHSATARHQFLYFCSVHIVAWQLANELTLSHRLIVSLDFVHTRVTVAEIPGGVLFFGLT